MSTFPTRVLLAFDGSTGAKQAARTAAVLSEMHGAELHLVYVESLPNALTHPESLFYGTEHREEVSENAWREAREKLDEYTIKVRWMGGNIAKTHAGVGRPDAEIVRLAEEIEADLVVVGHRGLGLLERMLLGSISASVLHHAHCTVLVTRGSRDGEELPLLEGNILVGVDGSPYSERAAAVAAQLASASGSELHVVYVARDLNSQVPVTSWLPQTTGERDRAMKRTMKRLAKFVADRAARLASGWRISAESHLEFGEADEEIVRLGEELDVALIVVGNRGSEGVARTLMGSVSDPVARGAHTSVLVVREGNRSQKD